MRQRWSGRRRWRRLATRAFYWVFAVTLLAAVVVALLTFVTGDRIWPVAPLGSRCDEAGYGCTVFNQLLFTAAPLALGFIVFLAWRYRRIPTAYVRLAKQAPTDLVETAGSMVGDVVGREDLCDVLQTELRDEEVRRPHVLVGGLGIGKTAVLVKLTNVLARRGAVPVPVRLRDAAEEIDFVGLARDRFLTVVGPQLRSAEEGDRIWKQLVKDDRVIVLADGLEEAFADEEAGRARHHRVRVAVHRAHEQKFPLVIASRPHEALRALDAALVHVEPLNADAALDYIRAESEAAEHNFEQLIEVADLTETPLYLQMARDLHDEDLLEQAIEGHLQSDRTTVRCLLLREWVTALVAKKLHRTESVPLDEAERVAVVEHLAALACIALREDTQQIRFDMWDARESIRIDATGELTAPRASDRRSRHQDDLREVLKKEIGARIQRAHKDLLSAGARTERSAPIVEMQAAASKGLRLGLVEPLANGVRFPHSIVQAYLAATMFPVIFGKDQLQEDYLTFAFRKTGRELLLALVMYSRMPPDSRATGQWVRWLDTVSRRLVEVARQDEPDSAPDPSAGGDSEVPRPLDDDKRIDLLAAAVEIYVEFCIRANRDGAWLFGDEGAIACRARTWSDIRTDDDTTQGAKLRLIQRLGEAARRLAARDQRPGGAARDSGAAEPRTAAPGSPPTPPSGPEHARHGCVGDVAAGRVYKWLYEIARLESSYRLRLAAAQEIGNGGDAAWFRLKDELDPASPVEKWEEWNKCLGAPQSDDDAGGEAVQRRCDLKGWLLPMLLGSVSDACRNDVDEALRGWVRHVGRGMPFSLEAALAQGFKHAANRRPHHSHEKSEARALLQAHATQMIFRAYFWYSRLTLIHALTLCELARLVHPGHTGHESRERPHDTRALVSRWLRRPPSAYEQHPFVLEAAELAESALETRDPSRFIWIDESGVVTKVGSQAERTKRHGRKNLWIQPSAGWMVLDGRAQQLVGDVLILLNLAERGEAAQQRDDRLVQANNSKLPLCLTEDRCAYLKPSQTVGRADIPNPGQDCKAGCQVALCPYPPRGQQAYRVELSEAFCRRQQVGLARWRLLRLDVVLRPRPWQRGPRAEQRRFWTEMEERARKPA